ncbi:MAG: hypothetical protein COS11_07585 [bacterium (Candidatus Ratteibacteria) CG01_land_8_20_14_3_00_40_19]|uniref:Uncharacterized protein n=2 Tax=Candidatus Ratteibacteria TaxID=2979319 RepID=A0A2M7E6T7_9BACT|nr:MAG: hypothetical protein COS11_07585 [bacterium (Candidatus Ratteibacteria) CG01_land_8_20_14_3_00_40_19]
MKVKIPNWSGFRAFYLSILLFAFPALIKASELPTLSFNPDSSYSSGIVQVSIGEASEDVFQVKLLCDEEALDIFFKFPAILSLDTTGYPDGIHLLTARAVIKGVGVREKDYYLSFANQDKKPTDSLSLFYQAIEEKNYQSAIEYLEKSKEEKEYSFLKGSLSLQTRLLEDLCKENFPVYQYRNDKELLEKLSFSERFPSPVLQIFSLRLLVQVSIGEASEDVFQVKLLCDEEALDIFFKFPAILSLDTTGYPDGIHLLTARAVIKGVGVREKDYYLSFANQDKKPTDSLSLFYQAIEEKNYQSAIEYLEKSKEEKEYSFLKGSLSLQTRLLEDLCKENFPVYQYRNDKELLEKLSFSERFPSPVLQIFSLRLLSKVSIRESDFLFSR